MNTQGDKIKLYKRKGKTRDRIFWVDRKTNKKVRIATS